MKLENTIQWSVIVAVVGVGLFVWLKPKMSHGWSTGPAPVPVPEVAEEVFSSNDLTAAVAPVELQSGFHSRYGKELSQRTWEDASDLLGQIGGVKLTKSTHPLVVLNVAIVDLHNEQKSFSGYGIQTRTQESLSTVRVQVLEAASGTVAFSKTLEGSKTDSQTTAASSVMPEVEREFAAVADALHKLDTNADFKKAVLRFQPNQTH